MELRVNMYHNNAKIRIVKLGHFVNGFNNDRVGALCF